MKNSKKINRRNALFQLYGAALGFGVGTSLVAQADPLPVNKRSSSTLVAYLSRSGNTRVIAETLARQMSADLFEIRTVEPYPDDYQAHVLRVRQQQETGELPALSGDFPVLMGIIRSFWPSQYGGGTCQHRFEAFLQIGTWATKRACRKLLSLTQP